MWWKDYHYPKLFIPKPVVFYIVSIYDLKELIIQYKGLHLRFLLPHSITLYKSILIIYNLTNQTNLINYQNLYNFTIIY